MTDLETTILTALEGGSPNFSISRERLVSLTGESDRVNRKVIASLQGQGFPIISLGKGYHFATGPAIKAYIHREKSRAISILKKIRNLEPQFGKVINQLELVF